MISWLQTNLQKHFRFVFIILLAVVIVAFVFTIGAAPGIGDGRQQNVKLRFFDFELSSEAQRQQFFDDASYSALLQMGGAQMNQEQLNQYAFNRAAALHLANIHNIPGPTTEQLTEHIQQLGMFMGPDQQFSREAYASFRDQIKASGRITEAELSLIMSDDYRVNKVYEALSSPGYVLDSEVIEELALDQTQWSINVAEFDLTKFEPEIDTSEEKLEAFFASNSFRYASPARRVISYVEFKALDHMAEVAVEEDSLKEYFESNASKYTKQVVPEPVEGETEPQEPKTELASFEESRDQVEFDFKLDAARKIAQSKAESLALSFVEADNASGPSDSLSIERIEALIEMKSLSPRQTTPFARNESPLGLNWNQSIIAISYQLTPNHIYSQPVIFGDSTLVLYLENENPEFVPSFKTVEQRVKEDYSVEETRRLRTVHGEELAAALSSIDPDSFKEEAESKGMKVTEFMDFKRRDTVEGLDSSLLFSVTDLDEGEVSDATIREDKGFVVQVVKKEIPEITKEDEAFEDRMTALKSNYSRYAISQFISKLTSDELIKAGLAAN